MTAIKVGALIIAIGTSLYNPSEKWHADEFSNVITSMELETMLSENGNNKLLKSAKHALFIQCVGSRSKDDGYSGCSRYCCATSVKQASQLKERGINCTVLYRDMRMVSDGAEEFYRDVRKQGVLFLRYSKDNPLKFNGKGKINPIRWLFTFTIIFW